MAKKTNSSRTSGEPRTVESAARTVVNPDAPSVDTTSEQNDDRGLEEAEDSAEPDAGPTARLFRSDAVVVNGAVLLVITGYLRLEEATKGYYTTLLRVAAIGVLVATAIGLVMTL
jgi:hypothetical protein